MRSIERYPCRVWRYKVEFGPSVGSCQFIQFSTFRPVTRLNARSLLVTGTRLAALACAAIQRSLLPMTSPVFSSAARISP